MSQQKGFHWGGSPELQWMMGGFCAALWMQALLSKMCSSFRVASVPLGGRTSSHPACQWFPINDLRGNFTLIVVTPTPPPPKKGKKYVAWTLDSVG